MNGRDMQYPPGKQHGNGDNTICRLSNWAHYYFCALGQQLLNEPHGDHEERFFT
jgi:hypothetical protein